MKKMSVYLIPVVLVFILATPQAATWSWPTLSGQAGAAIVVTSELPHIHASNLTLDASNAGVIMDGSLVPGDWEAGLQIVSSQANIIRGLQTANFSGPGIAISGDARNNVIGGDRSMVAGPFGQGNQLIHNATGVAPSTNGTSLNTITGNLIGTDAAGTAALGNQIGVWICEGASGNTIGPEQHSRQRLDGY